ncbi:hypothetical protein Ocin01_15071 [Orchesella cincta]|uniref:Uncharacterized protein n=1 Tax=Orchesella cincta TaxID=48709 RepID=A0A1D2MF29_ORCCI|nr:hypothetical protein Ocin01_15071 [Orchesella cincta]
MNKIVLTFLIGVLCHHTLASTEAGGNKTVSEAELTPKILERLVSYKTSIRYWDTKNVDTQTAILKELAAPSEEFKIPGCPRIRYPIICDDEGIILENVCYFRMRRREREHVLPIMIFTTTEIDEARSLCSKEVRKP